MAKEVVYFPMSEVNVVYGLGIVGAVVAVGRNIFVAMVLKMNVKALMMQLTKLVQAGNVDRALKLCRAAPGAYLTSGLIPALQVFQNGNAKRADLVQAFEQGIAPRKSLLILGRIIGGVAGLLAVAGIVYGVMHAEIVPSEAYLAPVIAGGLVFGGEMMARSVREEANVAFGRLLELLKEARS